MANLKITLVKSTIGAVPKHRRTVEALGLKKVNKTVVLPDNAATRGMVRKEILNIGRINSRCRKLRSESYYKQHCKGIQYFSPYDFNLKCFTECL